MIFSVYFVHMALLNGFKWNQLTTDIYSFEWCVSVYIFLMYPEVIFLFMQNIFFPFHNFFYRIFELELHTERVFIGNGKKCACSHGFANILLTLLLIESIYSENICWNWNQWIPFDKFVWRMERRNVRLWFYFCDKSLIWQTVFSKLYTYVLPFSTSSELWYFVAWKRNTRRNWKICWFMFLLIYFSFSVILYFFTSPKKYKMYFLLFCISFSVSINLKFVFIPF